METLKLTKSCLAIILLVLTLTSCSKGKERMDIIAYGTPEFNEFVKNAPISLDEAWEIQLDYANRNYSKEDYKWQQKFSALFFIVDGYYVFTIGHVNSKMLKGYLLDGIWVNTTTGKVLEKELQKTIQAQQIGWGK